MCPRTSVQESVRSTSESTVRVKSTGRPIRHVIVRPLSTVGYTSVASVIHCRQGLTNIIQDHSPEGSVTQLHECSVLWKTPLFSERKYTLLGSKVAEQGGGDNEGL